MRHITLPVFPTLRLSLNCLVAVSAIFFGGLSEARAFDDVPIVTYLPAQRLVEGDQPVLSSYTLSITSPSNVPAGPTLTITPVISVLSAPAGVTTAQALSFVSINPTALTFTGPGQVKTTLVTSNVPLGSVAGDYAYKIATPGWPAGTLDGFATINMKVTVAIIPQPPSVLLTAPTDGSVYTLAVPGPALSIPLRFQATAPAISPILTMGASISGQVIAVVPTGLLTGNASATGTIQVSAPGIYTVQAYANNLNGTSSTSAEITVKVSAAAPTVTIAQPVANATYTYTPGAPPLSVPFSFSATSAFGGIKSLTATLNGTAVAVTTSGLGTLTATGSGSLSVSAAGQYVFAVTATDQNGTTSASRSFTVTVPVAAPAPEVNISSPDDGHIFTRVAGSAPLSIPFTFTAKAKSGNTISSLSASLNGSAVTVTGTGLGKASATGTGVLTVSAAGSYTLVARATSGTTPGVDQVTFVVKETPPAPCTVLWLPPISLGKVQQGGSTLPIKFQIECPDSDTRHDCNDRNDDDDDHGHGDHGGDDNSDTMRDKSVKIAVYEIFSNGSTSTPSFFHYCSNDRSSDDDTYSIDGDDKYQLNFGTARGTHRYHIDVYRFPSGSSTPQLVGTKEFTTK